MPKFHVVCRKETLSKRVVLLVQARSASEARDKVEFSNNALGEFDEVGAYREDEFEVTVERVQNAK